MYKIPRNPMSPEGYVDEYRRHKLQNGITHHLNGAIHAIKVLRKALDVLPKDPNAPGIDLALVKILFDQKEDAHEKARSEESTVENYRCIVLMELDRCRENVERLRQDQAKLHSSGLRGHYSDLAKRQMEQYQRASSQKKTIMDILSALRALLRESEQRKYEKEVKATIPQPEQKPGKPTRRGDQKYE